LTVEIKLVEIQQIDNILELTFKSQSDYHIINGNA